MSHKETNVILLRISVYIKSPNTSLFSNIPCVRNVDSAILDEALWISSNHREFTMFLYCNTAQYNILTMCGPAEYSTKPFKTYEKCVDWAKLLAFT